MGRLLWDSREFGGIMKWLCSSSLERHHDDILLTLWSDTVTMGQSLEHRPRSSRKPSHATLTEYGERPLQGILIIHGPAPHASHATYSKLNI
ncbi:hypothetical protein J1N35_025459, partial [Gossypium stocksii]